MTWWQEALIDFFLIWSVWAAHLIKHSVCCNCTSYIRVEAIGLESLYLLNINLVAGHKFIGILGVWLCNKTVIKKIWCVHYIFCVLVTKIFQRCHFTTFVHSYQLIHHQFSSSILLQSSNRTSTELNHLYLMCASRQLDLVYSEFSLYIGQSWQVNELA